MWVCLVTWLCDCSHCIHTELDEYQIDYYKTRPKRSKSNPQRKGG